MKTVYRKGLLCLGIIVISVLLQGCDKRQSQSKESAVLSEDVTYEGTDIVLQGLEGKVQQYSMKNNILYVLTNEQKEFHLYKAEADGSNPVEISVSFPENSNVSSFYVDEENNIFCLAADGDEDCQMELVKMNAEGAEVAQTELDEMLSLSGKKLLNRVAVDGLGNVVVAGEDTVYLLDSDLHLANKIHVKENYKIVNFVRTKSGQIVCSEIKEDLDSGEGGGEICILDTEKEEWGSFLQMEGKVYIDEYCIMEGQEYEFYYKDGFGIYGYNIEENTWTKVLDARCSLLTAKDIDGMIGEEGGQFVGALSGSENGEDGFVLNMYSKVNPEKEENKKIITFAGYNIQDPLRILAREFNKTHDDCRIEIQIYEDEDHTRMAMDIATGKAPDIFCVSDMNIPVETWVQKGVLEDLTPYYEKDTEVHMEDVIPSALESMKTGGKIYFVAPYFSIWSAACTKSDAEGKKGWNFQEMKEALKKKGDGALAVEAMDKADMLYEFLVGSLNDFINWETGECDFENREFKDILEFCNEGTDCEQMSDKEIEAEYAEITDRMQAGKVLMSVDQSVTLKGIQEARQSFGSDITYIGLPAKDRQGSYFVYQIQDQYVISSGSNVKEEAWEFIRMVMQKEYQTNTKLLDRGMFPTRKDCLEWNLQALMATEPYEDEYGNWIEPVETEVWYTAAGEERRTGPASQEDVDIFLDLIERTNKRAILDDEAFMIIIEEAQVYFNGEKSLDAVCKIIQKRMTTYVNEQR